MCFRSAGKFCVKYCSGMLVNLHVSYCPHFKPRFIRESKLGDSRSIKSCKVLLALDFVGITVLWSQVPKTDIDQKIETCGPPSSSDNGKKKIPTEQKPANFRLNLPD